MEPLFSNAQKSSDVGYLAVRAGVDNKKIKLALEVILKESVNAWAFFRS